MNLDLYVRCSDSLMSEILHPKTGLSPPVIYYCPKAMLLLSFILIVNVRSLSVCLRLTVQFI